MTDRLLAIGFWGGPDAPDLPDPRSFVDEGWDPTERETVVGYLRRGFVLRAYLGKSACRICGTAVGSLELSDGLFDWPEGLAHYLEAHSVRLPHRFVEHVHRRTDELENADLDHGWWTSQTPEVIDARETAESSGRRANRSALPASSPPQSIEPISRDADLDSDISRLFRDPEHALAVLGRGPNAAPLGEQAAPLSASAPLAERVRLLDKEFRSQLRLLADQAAEFSDPDSLDQLEWEGIALLIAIRELHRHFPELDGDFPTS